MLRFIFCIYNKQSFLNTYLLRLWRCFAFVLKTGSNTLTSRVLTSCFEDRKTSNLHFALLAERYPLPLSLHGGIAAEGFAWLQESGYLPPTGKKHNRHRRLPCQAQACYRRCTSCRLDSTARRFFQQLRLGKKWLFLNWVNWAELAP